MTRAASARLERIVAVTLALASMLVLLAILAACQAPLR